jgi:hypothetical protein
VGVNLTHQAEPQAQAGIAQGTQLLNNTNLRLVNKFANPTDDLALVSLDYAHIKAGVIHLDLLLGPAACGLC